MRIHILPDLQAPGPCRVASCLSSCWVVGCCTLMFVGAMATAPRACSSAPRNYQRHTNGRAPARAAATARHRCLTHLALVLCVSHPRA